MGILRSLLTTAGVIAILLTGIACDSAGNGSGDVPPPAPPVEYGGDPGDSGPGIVEVGDRLELFVMEDESFNKILTVRERGDVIIPALGRIQVSGMSVQAAESRIKAALEENQLKKATVILDRVRAGDTDGDGPILESTRQILVYMTGEVPRPGQHVMTVPEDRSLGVYEAILISGGLKEFADEQRAHILRTDESGTRHRIPVNIRLIRQGSRSDTPLGHGDIVHVPERKFFGF